MQQTSAGNIRRRKTKNILYNGGEGGVSLERCVDLYVCIFRRFPSNITSVANPDLGSESFLDPESGISFFRIPSHTA